MQKRRGIAGVWGSRVFGITSGRVSQRKVYSVALGGHKGLAAGPGAFQGLGLRVRGIAVGHTEDDGLADIVFVSSSFSCSGR